MTIKGITRGKVGPTRRSSRPHHASMSPDTEQLSLGCVTRWPGLPFFAGTRGISAVEIRTDEDASWTKATLEVPVSGASWVFWHYEWIVPQAGSYTLSVRAIDGTGALQASMHKM